MLLAVILKLQWYVSKSTWLQQPARNNTDPFWPCHSLPFTSPSRSLSAEDQITLKPHLAVNTKEYAKELAAGWRCWGRQTRFRVDGTSSLFMNLQNKKSGAEQFNQWYKDRNHRWISKNKHSKNGRQNSNKKSEVNVEFKLDSQIKHYQPGTNHTSMHGS